MNQLPHAPICVTTFVGDVVLWKTFDEDGSQRLVLAVVGCRIGVQEELSAASVIHDRTPQVLVGFRSLPPQLRIGAVETQPSSPGCSRCLPVLELQSRHGAQIATLFRSASHAASSSGVITMGSKL
jgi:hypothetical protein